MQRTAYDVISIPLPNTEAKMSKQTTPTEEQKKIAFQLGLDPDRLAQQVALNQRSDEGEARSPYVSFSTADCAALGASHCTSPPTIPTRSCGRCWIRPRA
jgi:hypothetical protein